jgi:hypothetical protein
MAFRSDDQDYRWPRPGRGQSGASRDQDAPSDPLSLQDTLRELAVTIVGFVGVIVLITVVVTYFRG